MTLNEDIDGYWQNYIDGKYCDGGAGRIAVTNPGNNNMLAEHACADPADLNRAVEAAWRTHQSAVMSDMLPAERGRMVREMGSYLLTHLDEIARVLTLEQGKPYFEAAIEVRIAAGYFEYFGNLAATMGGGSVPLGNQHFDFTINEPYGVTALLSACHYPVFVPARTLSVALATGNCCVIKTPELTPISGVWFARAAAAAGFPPGVVNILCGNSQDVGAALVSHPLVDHVTSFGSVESGACIAQAAAKNFIPCVQELGGNSPSILFEDANLDVFQGEMERSVYWNAGQYCAAMSRIIVHKSRYDELVERAVAMAKAFSVAPGIEFAEIGLKMGPLDSDSQREKVLSKIHEAVASGAKLIVGGKKLNMPGSFMQPTILAEVQPDMKIAQEEVFGPVMVLMRFDDEAEAIEMANSSPYTGLAAFVFTNDISRATKAAHKLRVGHVVINGSSIGRVEIPFGGGFGRTGYGRITGPEAFKNYSRNKNVLLPIG